MPLTLTMGLLLLEQGKACWARQCRCSWLRTREGIRHVDEEEKEIYSPPIRPAPAYTQRSHCEPFP